jgi:acyl-CoA thioesterase-1
MLSLGLAICLVGCGARSEAPKPANAQLEAAPARPDPADSRPVIVCFGDSLSAGYGLPAGSSYPDVLQRLIDKAGYHYRVVNLGVSGDTTTNGVERVPAVTALNPAIVVLEFGGNDGLRGLPVESSEQNLRLMVEALQKSGAKVVLAGMSLPLNYGQEYIRSFEKIFVDVANRYKLVRIPFLLEGVGGHPDLIQQDGIHPTEQGTRMVATTVMKYLDKLLKK